MNGDNLIKMANQIADFFANTAEPDLAAVSIEQHLKLFWAPRMREQLALLSQQPSSGLVLHPLLQQVLTRQQHE
ncbi:formate dehydrogenase subunit delta [Neisseriaceae bacterium TC5R-5]|nr:formate dehydrogenase subunit delta [Neisseriaceae bacterium TC5R-5]